MKFTISTNIEEVLFKGRARVNEMRLGDFLTRELDGRGIVDTNRDVLLEEFFRDPTKYIRDKGALNEMQASLAQPATSTWCQGLVIFAREEAKRLLPIRCPRRGRRRRTNGSEGYQMEPFIWLPAERYFYPLLNSIGAYQRYTYRLRAVCDAQRQKLLLSGDIEQHPGPIAVLQMNVSCLTPSKLATLMAQGADIIPSRRLGSRQSRSPACTLEIMCSMHSRASAREAVWRCWCGKLSAPSVYPSPSPSMTPALKWWWSRLLWTRTVILL
ncbi:putative retrotransposon hot spot protein (RHS) [Trypanosoma cruzi]|uniref:Putative retrotransposon hot spot protein (RHS) n=1 Tax=Trypanosoma cruzi TaxID=5693 RepID=A0A2V2X7Q5_TRYCR|nr:putative retrotransposon hot spot protein (RHS) [Trypanosoma cruzi]